MLFVTIGLLLLAAAEDIRKMEVPNIYPLLIFIFSVIRAVADKAPLEFLFLNTLLVFAVLYMFWHFKGIGGADVKILSALAVGEGVGIWVIILIACIVFMAYAMALRKPKESMAFIPAVFVGAIAELFIVLN